MTNKDWLDTLPAETYLWVTRFLWREYCNYFNDSIAGVRQWLKTEHTDSDMLLFKMRNSGEYGWLNL